MSRVCLVCISLRAGGTERVVSALANHLVSRHEVEVILLTNREPFFELDPRIRLWQPDRARSDGHRIKYYFQVARLIRSVARSRMPDVIFSFGELIGPFVRLVTIGIPSKICIFHRGEPRRSLSGLGGWIRPLVYMLVDFVVVQTKQTRELLSSRYRHSKILVIPNPVAVPKSVPRLLDRPKVITNIGMIGRLKNQEFLLRKFAKCDPLEEWELQFLGDGPQKDGLEDLSKSLGVHQRVRFLGERKDVDQILRGSQIFAFASLSEGFPNALAEALAHGCASISFDCPTGPSDLIEDDANGILVSVGDDQRYEEQLRKLLNDEELRVRLSLRARQDIRTYSSDVVFKLFERLVPTAVSKV